MCLTDIGGMDAPAFWDVIVPTPYDVFPRFVVDISSPRLA